jgi:hypothetical protein
MVRSRNTGPAPGSTSGCFLSSSRPQSAKEEFPYSVGHHLARCRWEYFIPALSDLVPRVSELELVHGSEQLLARLSPFRCLMQDFTQCFDDGCTNNACVTVRGLRNALERRDKCISTIECKTSAQGCDGMGLSFLISDRIRFFLSISTSAAAQTSASANACASFAASFA